MKSAVHDRIEAIAGAIALDEASDDERREYREHISSCPACLSALGGEREIERVASTVSAARDGEVWNPDLGDVIGARTRRRSQTLRWGLGVLGMALAASFGLHAIFAASIPRLSNSASAPVVINAGVTRIVLEQNTATPKPAPPVAAAPQRRLIVTHNVVQIARAPVPAVAAPALPASDNKPRDLVAITVHPQDVAPPAHASNVPVWRRNDTSWRTVARTTTTSVTETAPQTLTHSAESLQISGNYTTREVAPVGGETAINPQPPMIAYDEGAEGTTVFEVLVDERGLPTKCVITKSAGYPVLDDAVCRAAMKARYTPKMVDGRAVPGTYHDAFTFHMSDQTSTIQQQIPSSAPGARPQRPSPPGPSQTNGSGGGF
ncbi:MAG TPA: TonB family protein [Candidatus Baltobacteraceae bacterium]|nr:TonB family protein [Candidatus Baltobacteraceae bacterium]